jgi:TonB family protein
MTDNNNYFRKFLMILTVLVLFSINLFAQEIPEKEDCKCDFSKFKPKFISHFLLNSVKTKVVPNYPAAAKAVNVKGKVKVKILVDKKGNVVKACIVEGHPLLQSSTEKASLQWKFKENFGLELKQKFKYLQDFLEFDFK